MSELAHQDLADASNGFGSSTLSSTTSHVPLNPSDRKRVGAWMTCFCVVGFDLEKGQALEHVYPPVEFSEAEQRTIRFNAFPDSNSFLHGDITFSFTIRRPPGSSPISYANPTQVGPSSPPDEPPPSSFRPRTASLSVPIPTMDDEYLYASVFFRQQPDPKIRRGYYQKSVVLISPLPLPGLWDRVTRLVGPVLFDLGLPALEAAVNNIAKWPSPSPGMHDLPLLGSVMQVHIPALPPTPATVQLLPLSAKTLGPLQVLAMTLPTALYPTFRDTLDHLWTLWELVLANEPIAVISSCPSVTSRAVEALAALVRPVPVERTYRPYLTIQDPDFRYFTKNHPPPRTILGVTNPHFHSALDRWPHVLQIGPPRNPLGKTKAPSAALTSLDIAQGLTTKHKRVVSRDVKLLAQLAQLTLEGAADVVLDNLLRRHFADLTDMFLAPIAKYVATLWPASLALSSPYPIQPATFRADAFLATLAPTSSNPLAPPPPAPFPVRSTATRWLPSGSDDWIDLYRNFLRTPQFAAWLEHRLAVDAQRWAEQYMALVCATDLTRWWAGGGRRSAVADVEGKVLRTRIAYLLGEENEWRPSPTQAVRLQAQLEALIDLISKSS
ncbi:hypothetical protein BCR44DRAFT_117476 [Catenaria anguillulae PL171]|uniref:UDENN domain-containing protein n=1 Tax=Catenaria anguillulae PL171 TaxID=765915 RepID=A0A1Y2HVZ4_9FUNG|nr:hypothetical protein BCR44DRAFT_117476 [Catenaria anguillulae PL171]